MHAARALGAKDLRLLSMHLVPSTVGPLIVVATVEVGLVIIAEASLSFLGLGTPSEQPSWGATIANGRAYLNTAWWISTMPGVALSLVVLAVGRFGDQVRDLLDPRSLTGVSAAHTTTRRNAPDDRHGIVMLSRRSISPPDAPGVLIRDCQRGRSFSSSR